MTSTGSRRLLRSTVLVMALFGLNKLTGFVRLQLVGDAFGTGPEADAFTAANQLPELFFVLVAGGALSAAFIPVYTDALQRAGERSRAVARLANTILTLVLIVLGGICLLSAAAAPWIVRVLLVPNFAPEQQALTASLMRIILLNTTLFGVSGVLTAILNGRQHFALPAVAPIALDIGYAIGIFWLVPTQGVYGLAWGTVIGALLHITIQVPALIHERVRIGPALALSLPGVREVIALMGPRIVMLGAIQWVDLIIIRVGSRFPTGSVSAYFFAFTLMQLPETLFGTAIALVLFPTMSARYNAGDLRGMTDLALQGLRIIWALTIPAAFAVVILGRPGIQVVLERGAFDAASTDLVYTILVYFSARIVSEASLEIVARLFYARHNTFVPMLAYLGWWALNWILIPVLALRLGIGGVALASTISFTLLAAALSILNRLALDTIDGRGLAVAFGRCVTAALGMSGVIVALGRLELSALAYLVVAVGTGTLVYGVLYVALGGRELHELWALVRRRAGQST